MLEDTRLRLIKEDIRKQQHTQYLQEIEEKTRARISSIETNIMSILEELFTSHMDSMEDEIQKHHLGQQATGVGFQKNEHNTNEMFATVETDIINRLEQLLLGNIGKQPVEEHRILDSNIDNGSVSQPQLKEYPRQILVTTCKQYHHSNPFNTGRLKHNENIKQREIGTMNEYILGSEELKAHLQVRKLYLLQNYLNDSFTSRLQTDIKHVVRLMGPNTIAHVIALTRQQETFLEQLKTQNKSTYKPIFTNYSYQTRRRTNPEEGECADDIVYTVASGQTQPYVGTSDLVLLPSLVDVCGLNSVSRVILTNVGAAFAGIVIERFKTPLDYCKFGENFTVGITMFGVTTTCVDVGKERLNKEGYETLVFHAAGVEGRAMKDLVRSGYIQGVLDVTTTKVADHLVGAVMACDESRFHAIIEKIPLC